jgi:hypothetical protein
MSASRQLACRLRDCRVLAFKRTWCQPVTPDRRIGRGRPSSRLAPAQGARSNREEAMLSLHSAQPAPRAVAVAPKVRRLTSRNRAVVGYAGWRLAQAVRRGSMPEPEAVQLAQLLSATAPQAGTAGRTATAVVLGILTEQSRAARAATAESLACWLGLLAAVRPDSREHLALQYLLSHFPDQRQRIATAGARYAPASAAYTQALTAA